MINSINFDLFDDVYNGMIIENIKTYEILHINKHAKKLLKIEPKNKILRLTQLISNEETYDKLEARILKDLEHNIKSEGTIYFACADNSFLEVDFTCNWLFKEKDIICYTFKKSAEVIAERSLTFKDIADQLPSGIIVMDIEHGLSITYANNEHYKILGVDDESIEENKTHLLKDFIFEEDTLWVLSEIHTHLANNEDVDIEFRMKASDDVTKWVRLYGRASMTDTGEKLFYSSIKDLSDRRNIDDKLHMQRVLFHKITELTEEVLFRLDLQTNIIHFLGKTTVLFGDKTVFENYPHSLLELNKIHKDDVVAHENLINCFKNAIEQPVELRYKVGEDLYEWYRITYNFVKNSSDKPISVIGKMSNVNNQKILEERAKTDLLTGFYNKITTQQEVDKIASYKNEKSFAFFIIDIDNFKAINDNLGHHFGDMVLTTISQDIKSLFRQDDILGRIGGDEFVVVMRDTGNTSLIVEKAELLCKMLRKTFLDNVNGDSNYSISASIGISMYPTDGTNFEELYKKSDLALYEIKNTTKNGYKQFFDDLNRKNISHTHKTHTDKRRSSVLLNNTIMTTILDFLYDAKDFEVTIALVLEYIGKMFKLDRCYIFETLDDGDSYFSNYGWTNEDATSFAKNSPNVKKIKKSNVNNMLELVDQDGVFYTNNLDSIKDEWSVKFLKKANVKSILLVESLDQHAEKSVFFTEDCKSKRVWSEEEVITLLHIGRLLFTALNYNRLVERLTKNKRFKTLKNYKPTKNTEEISNIICNYYNEANKNTSKIDMLKNISKYFNIDTIFSIAYDDDKLKYEKSYELKKNGELSFLFNYDNENFVNIFSYSEDLNKKDFFSILNDENYFYTDNYLAIKDELKKVGFIDENEDEIKELYVFSTRKSNFFNYISFIKYSEPKMTKEELKLLTAFCKIINSEVEKFDIIKKYEIETLMKNLIFKNEKMPMAVIEKDTFRVLYHNDFYCNIFPNIEVGAICYELLGKKKKCTDCCFDKDILINDSNHSENQWIKKSIPFTLNNNKEIYVIYSKDSIDYVNQINAIDNLTQSLLFRGFEEYYKTFIKKSPKNYALCTLDVDKFNYINDAFNYKTGDIILRKIALVIKDFISSEENFCRLNGDKFSIFVCYDDEVELHRKVRELSENLEHMKYKDFPDIKITVIGGITLVDKNLTLDALLDQATLARKSGKGSHKNKFSYYNPNIDMSIKREIHLEEQLPYAMANDEFIPFLQPKFDLHTNKICGAEALVRWISKKGLIYPNQFIPLFERNGFILTLDFIIYDKVMEHIRECLDTGLKVYPISVNVSRNHVKDDAFLDKFMSLINKYNIPHEYLELEITESIFEENKEALRAFVDGIKNLNFKVSIDDFGTAYSSLQSLTGMDVDILKIDKGFLDNVDMSIDAVTKDELLIKNIINLAGDLDFGVICEGIESEKQVELLKKIACKYGQGYIFAKPMPIEEYKEKFLRN